MAPLGSGSGRLLSAALIAVLTSPGLGAATDDPSWSPAPGGSFQPTTELASGGMRLQVRGGRLACWKRGVEVTLGVLEEEGTGRVIDLARDPAGTCVVAAERGVFVVSGEVDVLDRLEPLDDLDLSGVRSVHVDGRRRLWFAGDGIFGVLEMGAQWGYRFDRESLPDGLAEAESLRVGPAGGGALLVTGERGGRTVASYRYTPDAGGAPRIETLLVDGEPVDPALPLEITYPEAFRLEVRGTALGGLHPRFRVNEHHVWRDLALAPRIEGLTPGERPLDVVLLDRDLNRSEPLRLRVLVAFPARFDERFVVAAALVFGGLALALFLRYEKRSGWRPGAWLRAPLAAALLTIVTLQVIAGIEPHGKGWPFVGYTMYTTRFDEGDVIFESVLYGLQENGGTRVIPPQAVGVAIDGRWQVLGPLVDRGEEVARQYLATYNERHPGSRLVGLQVRARRHRLTWGGAVEVAPQILSHYREPRVGGPARGGPGGGGRHDG